MRLPRLLSGLAAVTATLAVSLIAFVPGGAASAATVSSPFTAYVGVGDPGGLHALADRIGAPIGYATDYLDDRSWSQLDDVWDMANWQGAGYRMIWGVPMLPISGATLAQGATGAYDQYFTAVAKDLVAYGMGDSVLRLGWEFNNSGYPWYAAGQAASFVAYWRHIVTAMRAVPGAAFRFEWNPNLGDNGPSDKAMGDMTAYYPGDAYVDIVGLDTYDINWNTYPGTAQEFASIETRKWGLDWLAGMGQQHAKPLSIAEFGLGWGTSAGDGQPVTGTGVVSGGDNPGFVEDMAAWIAQHDVAVSGFWDYSTSSIEDGQNPLTAQAVAVAFGAAQAPAPSPAPTGSPTPSPTPTVTPTPSPTPTPTTTGGHKKHKARMALRRVRATAGRVAVTGALRPAVAGHLIVVQTARRPHGRWHDHGRVTTRSGGNFRVVVHRAAARDRYVRLVSRAGHGLRAAHTHPVALAGH